MWPQKRAAKVIILRTCTCFHAIIIILFFFAYTKSVHRTF